MDLRTNSDYFTIQHYLIGFYNPGKGCLLPGMNWVFKSDRYILVIKGLMYVNGSIVVNTIYRVHNYSNVKCLWQSRIIVTLDIFGQSLLPCGRTLSERNSHKKKMRSWKHVTLCFDGIYCIIHRISQ